MLINNETYMENNVKFVSYTGKYPNLCRGVLTLEIEGVEWKFGHDYSVGWENDGNHDRFWYSGGECYFTNNYSNSHVSSGEWIIDAHKIPEEIRKYAAEINVVFNDNVEYGCCGGCL